MRILRVLAASVVAVVAIAFALRALARSRRVQLFSRPVASVDTPDSIVALTFDDGPTDVRVDTLLAILQSRNVHATFFIIGTGIAEAPTAARALVTAGHEIGNHTYTHQHMVFRSLGRYRDEVARADSLLRAAGAHDPIYFRPPYGYKLLGLPYVLWRMGRTTVTWDIEPESYPEVVKTPDGIVRHVLARVHPGSIILLHPWYASGATTRRAMPALIDSLQARGYHLTTVSGLLARRRRELHD
jgi:peptidoglycan/xylan/chitin deacetylase (PgdA/CDA1 family)